MYDSILVPVWLVASLVAPSGSQSESANRGLDSSLRMTTEQVPIALDGLAISLTELATLSGRTSRLEGLRLPGSEPIDLVLSPVTPWEEGGTAIIVDAGGEERRLAPSIRLFELGVRGGDGHGLLGVSRILVQGVIEYRGETFMLSNAGVPENPVSIARAELQGIESFDAWCGTAMNSAAGSEVQVSQGPSKSATPELRVTTAFIEVDFSLRNYFASDQEAVDYATLLVGAADVLYRRDLGVRITIPSGYLRVWNKKAPWGKLSPLLATTTLSTYWNSQSNPKRNLPRTQVHVLTRIYNPASSSTNWGFAHGIGVICNRKQAYAVTSVSGSFPYPVLHLSPNNADLYLFAHESGHLFGSLHTFQYAPPIPCDDGSGPDMGTLMSYCYGASGTSVAGIGMRFHPRVQSKILTVVDSARCVVRQPLLLGDYDGNGVLDPVDLGHLDAYSIQGFQSLGALETLDMNGDGVLDSVDHSILEAAMIEPASSRVFNGSGVNRLGFESISPPVLGSKWRGLVSGRSDEPLLTLVVATTERLPVPHSTDHGELLVALPGVGGALLFKTTSLTNGWDAVHEFALPLDTSFASLAIHAQAAVMRPAGLEFLNGLELTLSTYGTPGPR